MNNTTSPREQHGPVTLRSYQPLDPARTVAMWHETNLASGPYVEEHQRHTLEDATARSFHEKHGFHVVAFGISPAPESDPDVEYRWSPSHA